MNTKDLSKYIRARANDIDAKDGNRDDSELLRVLARVVEGRELRESFGAPGDWGYDSPVGAALYNRKPMAS